MVSELDEVRDAAARLRDQLETQPRRRRPARPRHGPSAGRAVRLLVRSGRTSRAGSTARHPGDGRGGARGPSRAQQSGGGVPRPGARVGGGPPQGPRTRRLGGLHGRERRARGARGGAAARVRHRRRPRRPIGGGARGRGPRRRGRALARVPPRGRRPPGLRRARRLRRGAPRGRAARQRRQDVPLRLPGPQGRRPGRPRRPRHRRVRRAEAAGRPRRGGIAGVPGAALSRRRQALRARGAAGPHPEVHGRIPRPRSIGSAAPRGRRPRPACGRPCATWPRSC